MNFHGVLMGSIIRNMEGSCGDGSKAMESLGDDSVYFVLCQFVGIYAHIQLVQHQHFRPCLLSRSCDISGVLESADSYEITSWYMVYPCLSQYNPMI